MAIRSFASKTVEQFFETGKTASKVSWKNLTSTVLRKLDMLHYAKELKDLKSPPGNRLELLKGKRKKHYSVRINDQWRIVFIWTELGPVNVDIVDYHK